MANWYMKVVQSNSPYKTFSDVLNDPRFRMDRQKMTAHDQKTIQGLFKDKKSTSYRSADKLFKALETGDLEKMPLREAIDLSTKVEPRIATEFMRQWRQAKDPATKSQIRATNRYVSQNLTELYRSIFRNGKELKKVRSKGDNGIKVCFVSLTLSLER